MGFALSCGQPTRVCPSARDTGGTLSGRQRHGQVPRQSEWGSRRRPGSFGDQRRASQAGDGTSLHGGAIWGPGCTRIAPRSDAFHTGKDPSRTNMAKPSIASGRSKSSTSRTARPTMQAEFGPSAAGDRLSIENITPDRSGLSASGSALILRHRQCHRAQASGRSG